MVLLYIIFSLCISSWMIHALPVSSGKNMQTVFYQEKTKLYDHADEWFMSQEYDVFSSITDYYENIVDLTLSSESEELLLNLVYLPKASMNKALILQGQLLGFDHLSDKQLTKMPSIIGKHIQAMNAKVYNSVENIITLYWHTIWDPKLLTHIDDQEDHILSFLSSFNAIVAKQLMEEMDDYDLLQEIKTDLLYISSRATVLEQEEKSIINWFTSCMINLFTSSTTNVPRSDALDADFLSQHLSGIRTSLLMELHVQFMDFYAIVQADIIEQLSTYYDN